MTVDVHTECKHDGWRTGVNDNLMNRSPGELSAVAVAILSPLDRARCLWLKALGPVARVLVRRRELRVTAAGFGVVTFAMAATLMSPFWLLALGPVLLGVPHLVADLRYLVFRPGLHLRRALWLPVGVPLLLAGAGFHPVYAGLVACAGMAFLARGTLARKTAALGVTGALTAGAWAAGASAALIMAHLHNFIAVLLWWCWRPRHGGRQLAVPFLFLLGSVLLFTGVLQPWAMGFAWQPAGLGPEYHLSFLAPGVAEPWALRLVLLFAFAQSVHYGVWLRLIPEDDRPQATPRTFRASARALRTDLGLPLLLGGVALSLVVGLWATVDLAVAREGYLRMALFHGYLELVAAAWLFIERPQSSSLANVERPDPAVVS